MTCFITSPFILSSHTFIQYNTTSPLIIISMSQKPFPPQLPPLKQNNMDLLPNKQDSTSSTTKPSRRNIILSQPKTNTSTPPPPRVSDKLSPKKEGQELLPDNSSSSSSSSSLRQHVNNDSSNNIKEATLTTQMMIHKDNNGRERLKRHREEVAGHVRIPDKWSQENYLREWMDYSTFDKLLAPQGLASAREALIAEGRRASSQRLRIESRCY